MRQFIACCLLGMVQPLSASAQPAWVVDTGKSSVSFEYVESGKIKSGAFDTFVASIVFDPALPKEASASFVVDTASIDLNDAMREGVLASVPWFDSERYPKAEFRLTDLSPAPGGTYVADGMLRIKKTELPVQVKVSLVLEDGDARAKGVLEIDRRDFRLRDALLESIVSVGETVSIGFDLIAKIGKQ